eukprot:1249456-Rhodomonas_salina.1
MCTQSPPGMLTPHSTQRRPPGKDRPCVGARARRGRSRSCRWWPRASPTCAPTSGPRLRRPA